MQSYEESITGWDQCFVFHSVTGKTSGPLITEVSLSKQMEDDNPRETADPDWFVRQLCEDR